MESKASFNLDQTDIEVGDFKQPDFYSQIKFKKLDNNTNFSIRYSDTPADSTNVDGDIISGVHGTVSTQMYPIKIESSLNSIRWIQLDAIDPETASACHEFFIKNFRTVNKNIINDSQLIISSYRINQPTIILNDFMPLEKYLSGLQDISTIRMITGAKTPIYTDQGIVIYTIYYGTNKIDPLIINSSISTVAKEYGLDVIQKETKLFWNETNYFHEYFISDGVLTGIFNINCVSKLNDYLINPIDTFSVGLSNIFNNLDYTNYTVLMSKFINGILTAIDPLIIFNTDPYTESDLSKIEYIKSLQSYPDWIPYAIRPDPDFYYWTPNNSFEFELILQEEPLDRKVIFTLQYKNLNFTVQPQLSLQERLNGELRLPHIENSIVGYSGNTKVIHLYTPWVIDFNGVKKFCEHYIIDENYTIIIPEGLVYPVTLDPTLGYSSIGGTLTSAITSASNSFIFATRFTNTTLYNTPAIFFYQANAVTTTSSQCAIYATGIDNTVTNKRLATTNAGSVITGSSGFVGNAFTNPIQLNPNTDYIIAFTDIGVAGGTQFAYDTLTGSVSYTLAQSYVADTFPSSINNSWTIQRDRVYSVYAFVGYSFPIMGLSTGTLTTSSLFNHVNRGGTPGSTSVIRQQCPGNGTYCFTNLGFKLSTSPGVGNSRTISVSLNGNTNLNTTISNTSTTGNNNVNAVTLTNGQEIYLSFTVSGTPSNSSNNSQIVVQTGIGQLLFMAGKPLNTTTTTYAGISDVPTITGTNVVQQYFPESGTLRNFSVNEWANVITAGTYTVTLFKGNLAGAASATSITFTLNSSTHSASDTSNSVSVVEGDYLYWQFTPSAITTSGTFYLNTGCEYFSNIPGNGILLGGSQTSYSTVTRFFNWTSTDAAADTSEISAYSSLIRIRKIFGYLSAAPGSGNSKTVTFRNNGTDTPAILTISDSNVSGSWNELPQKTVVVDKNSTINISSVLSGSPTTSTLQYSIVFSSFLPIANNHRYDYRNEPITDMFGFETLSSSGAISTTIPTTEIVDYTFSGIYTLASGTVDGFIKTIYIQNMSMFVQINLPKGSIILNSFYPSVTLEWDSTLDSASNGNWRILKKSTQIFPSRQQGTKLIGTGFTGDSQQGASVALSADGNTLAVGGSGDDGAGTDVGATWVFTRSGTVWTQQGAKLIGTGFSGNSQQASNVVLSSDGNTLAISGSKDDGAGTDVGGFWVFTRSGTVWTQQGTKLVGTGFTGDANISHSLAISGDGNTIAAGAQLEDNPSNNYGSVWIFTRTGTIWTQQGPKLRGTGATSGANIQQGMSVALSYDGNTLAECAFADDEAGANVGATFIFTRSGTVWTQQGGKLIGTGFTGDPRNISVAMSYDGNTVAVGGYIDDGVGTNVGATWVFTRSGTVWTQQGAKLVGTGFSGDSQQGISVALSSNGNTLAVGGNLDDGAGTNVGATWIFTRTNGVWTQQGVKLLGTGFTGDSQQGGSVSLSTDGNTLAVGGQTDDSSGTDVGATWIFI